MTLSDHTLRKLENLSYVPRGIRRGAFKGDRRSPRRGASIEFADYRAYVPGDDLRRLDWNVYARSDRPYLKLFEEEEDLGVYILLDASRSMAWGEESGNKLAFARSLAAGMGLIALAGGDQCSISILSEDRPVSQFGPFRNLMSFTRLPPFLDSQQAYGKTNLNRSIRIFAQQPHPPGIAVLITDLFSPTGYQDGLKHLGRAGHEIILIQVLSPNETDPPMTGELRLTDSETGAALEVSLTADLRRQYQDRVQAWQTEINRFCQARRIHYFPLLTSEPPDHFLLYDLRRRGLVR